MQFLIKLTFDVKHLMLYSPSYQLTQYALASLHSSTHFFSGLPENKVTEKNLPKEYAVYFIIEKFETGEMLLGIVLKQISHLGRKDEKRPI